MNNWEKDFKKKMVEISTIRNWGLEGGSEHLTGHIHYRSPFEMDDDCGTCDGAKCDYCNRITDEYHYRMCLHTNNDITIPELCKKCGMPEDMAEAYWDDFSNKFPFYMLPNESDLFEYKFDLYKELVEKYGKDILNVLDSSKETDCAANHMWNPHFNVMENGTIALKVRDDKRERILYVIAGKEDNEYPTFSVVFPHSQFGNVPAKYMEYFHKSGTFRSVNQEFSLEFTIGCGTLADLFEGWRKIEAEEVDDDSNFWKDYNILS